MNHHNDIGADHDVIEGLAPNGERACVTCESEWCDVCGAGPHERCDKDCYNAVPADE